MAPIKIRRDEYEEKYYIPKQWMYGQIIGKKGRTLEHIKDRSGLHHIYMDINNGYCLLVGDQKSIKRGKEVINELLNLSAPANTDTAAAAQPKGTPKSAKPSPSVPKTKKLPPLPSEPKPVGQVSRFSLLVTGDEDDDEDDDEEEPEQETTQDKINSLDRHEFPTVRATSKESPLSRLVPPVPPSSSKKKKKKGRKQSTSSLTSDKSEKEKKCQPQTPPAPPVSLSCSSLSTQGTTTSTTSAGSSAEQALDTDFLKTSQNLQLGDIRKSLEHFTNLTDGPFSGALEYSLSNSLSEGLSGVEHPADKSFDHDLYNNVLSSNIYGTLSSLTGRLISGLKVLDDSTLTKNDEKENQENVDTSELINDENNNEPSKSDDLKAKDKKDEKSDELPMSEVEVLRDQVNRLNNENSFLRDQLKLYQTCRICKDMLEWNEKRVALSCGHIFCSACANKFWKEGRCRVCEQRPSGFSYIAMFT